MGAIASQITSLTIVYSIVYSDADQRKHQSSASLAFVRGIYRWPVNSPHKRPVTRKMFFFSIWRRHHVIGTYKWWVKINKKKMIISTMVPCAPSMPTTKICGSCPVNHKFWTWKRLFFCLFGNRFETVIEALLTNCSNVLKPRSFATVFKMFSIGLHCIFKTCHYGYLKFLCKCFVILDANVIRTFSSGFW